LSVGVSVPVDIYNQRRRRIDLANAEITLKEAEIAARQRELASQIFVNYAEALAALRELQVLEELLELDTQTVRFVQIRVNEGEQRFNLVVRLNEDTGKNIDSIKNLSSASARYLCHRRFDNFDAFDAFDFADALRLV